MSNVPSSPKGSMSTAPSELEDARLGVVLDGKYRLLRKLGEGGMGAVYEAVHTVVDRPMAVKFLHAELAKHPDLLARFKSEAKAAGAIQDEHIVAVTDFGTAQDGAPYLVMEYLAGEDLRTLLSQEGILPVPRAANLLLQACRGLAVAHARGIVHRDLKPENLFLCKRGDGTDLLKILDFGIAKSRRVGTGAVKTQTGVLIGTLSYMPPEQVRGDAEITAQADVYALGAILYEALSGELAHSGEETHSIIYSIMHERPTPLLELRPELPAALAEAIHRALSFKREDRFPDVEAFGNALLPFVGRPITPFDSLLSADTPGLGSTHAPGAAVSTLDAALLGSTAQRRAASVPATRARRDARSQRPVSYTEPPVPARTSRVPLGLGIFAAVAALVALGWTVLRETDRAEPTLSATAAPPVVAVSESFAPKAPVAPPQSTRTALAQTTPPVAPLARTMPSTVANAMPLPHSPGVAHRRPHLSERQQGVLRTSVAPAPASAGPASTTLTPTVLTPTVQSPVIVPSAAPKTAPAPKDNVILRARGGRTLEFDRESPYE